MSPSARAGAQVESGEPGPRHSLLADIAAQSVGQTGPRCSVGKILLTLDEQDAADLRIALTTRVRLGADFRYSHGQVASGLRKSNIIVSEETVGRHRRGGCQCPTS
jgi:hypothetical protein